MIEARTQAAGLTVRLARKAARLAQAHAENRARSRDPQRWRRAALLWPLFGKD